MDNPLVELRRYTLRPGRCDDLVALFERHLVAGQEEVGMRIEGVFADVDAPERFVWLRSFADAAARSAGLRAFYGGPVWAEHREAANATMVDFSDVLLLQRVSGSFAPSGGAEPRVLVVVRWGGDDTGSAPPLGAPAVVLRTADVADDFPALPVRPEPAAVWCAAFPDADAAGAARARLAAAPDWAGAETAELAPVPWSAWR